LGGPAADLPPLFRTLGPVGGSCNNEVLTSLPNADSKAR
jgi:hypothetical protein